jgi:hypothetical protein
MERTQQFYVMSLVEMAKQAMDQMMIASSHAGETYRLLHHFLTQPSINHPVAQQHPNMQVLVAELQHCPVRLGSSIASTLLRHMDLNHGQRAAADNHTVAVDKLLQQLQRRNLHALRQQLP